MIYWKKRLYSQVTRAKKKHFEMTGEKAEITINFDAIVKHLGTPNGDLEDYEIDHIVPLNYFLNGNAKYIEDAFNPKNLRWILKSENRQKSAKLNSEMEVEVFNSMQNDSQ